MIGRLLCGTGVHAWTREVRDIPPRPPLFPAPAFINLTCTRCGKTDWTFTDDRKA